MTNKVKAARAEIDMLIAVAKEDGNACVGLPVAELELVLADLDDVTPSEGGKALAEGKKK